MKRKKLLYIVDGAKYRPEGLRYDGDSLLKVFLAYVEYVEDHPWYRQEVIKSGDMAGQIIDVERTAPLLIGNFLLFAGITWDRWHRDFAKPGCPFNMLYGDIVDHITRSIKWDTLDGATVGSYNPGMVQRLHNLDVTKQEVTINGQIHLQPITGMKILDSEKDE